LCHCILICSNVR